MNLILDFVKAMANDHPWVIYATLALIVFLIVGIIVAVRYGVSWNRSSSIVFGAKKSPSDNLTVTTPTPLPRRGSTSASETFFHEFLLEALCDGGEVSLLCSGAAQLRDFIYSLDRQKLPLRHGRLSVYTRSREHLPTEQEQYRRALSQIRNKAKLLGIDVSFLELKWDYLMLAGIIIHNRAAISFYVRSSKETTRIGPSYRVLDRSSALADDLDLARLVTHWESTIKALYKPIDFGKDS